MHIGHFAAGFLAAGINTALVFGPVLVESISADLRPKMQQGIVAAVHGHEFVLADLDRHKALPYKVTAETVFAVNGEESEQDQALQPGSRAWVWHDADRIASRVDVEHQRKPH